MFSYIPYAIGLALATVQLCIYTYYRPGHDDDVDSEDDEEEEEGETEGDEEDGTKNGIDGQWDVQFRSVKLK